MSANHRKRFKANEAADLVMMDDTELEQTLGLAISDDDNDEAGDEFVQDDSDHPDEEFDGRLCLQ